MKKKDEKSSEKNMARHTMLAHLADQISSDALKNQTKLKPTKQTMAIQTKAIQTKEIPHHSILFNIAAHTVLKLTAKDTKKIYEYIESTVNGDGLYEGASKETILEAYYNLQMSEAHGLNWIDHIQEILKELNPIKHSSTAS